jgi:predicted alpha/beta-fold hydrolase
MEQHLSDYKPSWFYIHQALVIVHSCLVPAPCKVTYERVQAVAKTKTAGILTYDIARAPIPTKKALLIVPGVCGNSQEAYIMHLANEARLKGFNVLIINPTAPATVGEEFDSKVD